MNEFELIERYFVRANQSDNIRIGIGDDAAVLSVEKGKELVVATDTLVEGIHFSREQAASSLGHKTLAVNLSDLAAMSANPSWVTLNLVLPPDLHEQWVGEFARGFLGLADRFKVALVGGDTSCGPLSMTATVGGWVTKGQASSRSGACAGDTIYVSGTLGDAALGLDLARRGEISFRDRNNIFLKKLMWPEPRILLGDKLRSVATSIIDISDGLMADLDHILSQSGDLGGLLYEDKIPINVAALQSYSRRDCTKFALSGGDDYELCFTVPPEKGNLFETLIEEVDTNVTAIGIIDSNPGIRVFDLNDRRVDISKMGYLHNW
ncbi:MAG: thiamine-phosphate kinase [Acidiferrobacteraceae bacterium]|nr:thiamine-phosphate kinase [Acidiferrobacteraceae bacterium]|tara:strand:+ start:8654 stop:9619 length:966 start_codon:yes stop_codon:yes gene_type:complete